jgi:hypothetical protein
MRGKYFFRYMLLISLIVAATMGCKLIENVRSTVQLASTGVAVATDIGGMITQIVPPGMEQTVQAGMPTIQSAITEMAPTIESAITEIAPTLEAVQTQVYTSPEQAPADIPIMPGETSAFVGSPQAISYVTKAEFSKVVDFYKAEMPNKGWKSVDSGTGPSAAVPGMSNAELHFEKDTRKATVVITEIPFVGQTTVVINLEGG